MNENREETETEHLFTSCQEKIIMDLIKKKGEDAMQLRFQKWDIAVIFVVVLLAVLVFSFFFFSETSEGAYAEIYRDGQRIKTLSLSENQTYVVDGRYSNTITVRDGKIAVTASDCPGGDCVSCGWISGAGRSIICLPNGLEIRVVGGSGDVDFVVG